MNAAGMLTDLIDWAALVAIEPRLIDLRDRARDTPFSWQEYEKFKRELQRLVGWYCGNPAISSPQAYDVAHRTILHALEQEGPN